MNKQLQKSPRHNLYYLFAEESHETLPLDTATEILEALLSEHNRLFSETVTSEKKKPP